MKTCMAYSFACRFSWKGYRLGELAAVSILMQGVYTGLVIHGYPIQE